MLSKEKIGALIKYYTNSAKNDLLDMNSLYKSKRYSACLFFGHLLLEKILKALVVQSTGEAALKIHNLKRLAEEGDAGLTDAELDMLSEINTFNMESRYPDEKLDFYKKCTKSYTDPYHHFIRNLYKKLCQKLK